MTHREDIPVHPGNGANHRHPGIFLDRLGDQPPLPLGGDLIEHHPANLDPGLELDAAEHHRRHGAGGLGAVHHQQHRHTESDRQFRGRVAAIGGHSVIETTIALEQRNLRPMRMMEKRFTQLRLSHQVGVEIVALAPGGELHPAGIDIVRPLLERHYRPAPGR